MGRVLSERWERVPCLQEALACSNEGQLSTGTVRLSLAPSDALHQQRNLFCHSLWVKTSREPPHHRPEAGGVSLLPPILTLQLCTSRGWGPAEALAAEAACWAAAMVCVAEAAACLAACCEDRVVRTSPRRSPTQSLAPPGVVPPTVPTLLLLAHVPASPPGAAPASS